MDEKPLPVGGDAKTRVSWETFKKDGKPELLMGFIQLLLILPKSLECLSQAIQTVVAFIFLHNIKQKYYVTQRVFTKTAVNP